MAKTNRAVTLSGPDAVVSTASVGSLGGDANMFARDRDAVEAIAQALPLPESVLLRLQARYAPPASVSTGISLCLNKRLSSSKTQHLLGWSPRRTDILTDLESGSYTNHS